MTIVTLPLSTGRITMSLSFLSRLRACCSSLVKLLSCSDADCIVEFYFFNSTSDVTLSRLR